MIGAIVGDVIGSRWEGSKHPKSRNFLLFNKKCRFTDDTVLTVATADAILRRTEIMPQNIQIVGTVALSRDG
jgi:ADP-ribosylglycohydrolase